MNLASNEYSVSVDFKSINGSVISLVFKDWKNGEYKSLVFMRRARGLMARFKVESDAKTMDDLTQFDIYTDIAIPTRFLKG